MSVMFGYDNLLWSVAFPVVCAVMMYFSMALALLGRCRYEMELRSRKKAATERVLASATQPQLGVCATAMVGMALPRPCTHTSAAASGASHEDGIAVFGCPVEMPQSLSRDVRAVLHRAVVVVGGEFAYSPRMQRHAASLARSGLFSEVVLVGVCRRSGALMHDLLHVSGQPTPLCFGRWHAATNTLHNNRNGHCKDMWSSTCSNNSNGTRNSSNDSEDEVMVVESSEAVWHEHADEQSRRACNVACNISAATATSVAAAAMGAEVGHSSSQALDTNTARDGTRYSAQRVLDSTAKAQPISFGCDINTSYLLSEPELPQWLPLRLASMPWLVRTVYRVVHYTISFTAALLCTMVLRVNGDGKLLVTDVVLMQTPPAVPFVLLVKYIARPLAFIYNVVVYYAFLLPMSWLYMDAMRDVRAQCALQHKCSISTLFGRDDVALGAMELARQRHLQQVCAQASQPLVLTQRRFLCRPLLIVDWHNYGYSILQQAHRPRWACAFYRSLELRLCSGDINATVSAAMRRSLHTHLMPKKQQQRGSNDKTTAATSTMTHENDVLLVYDVPAVHASRLASRRHLLYDVLASMDNTGSDSCTQQTSDKNSSKASAWGIAPPPAWVVEDAAVERGALDTGTAACVDVVDVADSSNGKHNSTTARRTAFAAAPQLRGSPMRSGSNNTSSTGTPAAPSSPVAAATVSPALFGQHHHHRRRGIIVVGATSWTPEDDYTVLIDALRRLDARLAHVQRYAATTSATLTTDTSQSVHSNVNGNNQPRRRQQQVPLQNVWVVITGRGSARARFERDVAAARLSPRVTVSTVYLPLYEHYCALLASADVGLCLHFSTSGLDLPMKAIDMLSAGLPILAYHYPVLQEIVGQPIAASAPAATPSSSSQPRRVGGGLVECECGWLFSTADELEVALAHLVGLHDLVWRGVVHATCPLQHHSHAQHGRQKDSSEDEIDEKGDGTLLRHGSENSYSHSSNGTSNENIDVLCDGSTFAIESLAVNDSNVSSDEADAMMGVMCTLTMSLSQARQSARTWRARRRMWHDEWNATMLPVLYNNV